MKTIYLVIICLAFLLAGILFWPTIYRYDRLVQGNVMTLVRSNRLTGNTQRYLVGKWIKDSDSSAELPDSIKSKMTIQGSLNAISKYFQGSIYNGSNAVITSIQIEITIQHPIALNLLPEFSTNSTYSVQVNAAPLSASEFSFLVEIDDTEVFKRYSLYKAFGYIEPH